MQYNPTYMNHAAAAAGVAVMKNSTPIYSVILLKLPSFARALTHLWDLWSVQVYSSPFLLSPSFSTSPHRRQDNTNLYMVLEFISGGEMFSHLRRLGKFR